MGYERSFVRGDVIAGLTVWAVLVPEVLAYAAITGRRPLRIARGADPVRRVRHLAPSRHRADGSDGGAVGGGGGRPRDVRHGPSRAPP
jgi:sulfate permease, SulP family